MAFNEYRRWISDRQADIQAELDALEALETPRSVLFEQAAARITDRAVAIAGTVTDPDGVTPQLRAKVQAILTAAFPSGLPEEGSPVSGATSAKLFLNEALVLLGLALKNDPSGAVRGLLKSPIDSLLASTKSGQETVSKILSVLTNIENEKVGQGISLPSTDTRVDSLLLGLAQAKDGAERTLANLTGQQPVNASLSQQVQSFLSSAMQALVQDSGNVDRLDSITRGISEGLSSSLRSTESTIKSIKANILKFRRSYAGTATGLSSDRAQISALTEQVTKLQETVIAARGAFPDVASFRTDWLNTVFSLIAITRESRTVAAQTIFESDTDLGADYDALAASLALIPDTDLSDLTNSLDNLRSLLLGVSTDSNFQDQYTQTLSRVKDLLTIYRDRLAALRSAVENYPLKPSALLDRLLSIVVDSKMRAAEDALKSGDIESFMGLAVGQLNPVDLISAEIRDFLGDDQTVDLSKDLSDGLASVISFEQADIQAAQGFEDSRKSRITELQAELLNLSNQLSILDKAEAQRS